MAIQTYADAEKALAVYQKVVIFGAPASGKTTLALSLAEEYNIIYFAFENNFTRAIAPLPTAWKKRIFMIRLPDSGIDPVASETMYKIGQGLSGEICVEHGRFNCLACIRADKPTSTWNKKLINRKNTKIVFDSATQLSASIAAKINGGKGENYKFDYDDWAVQGNMLNTIFSWNQAVDLDTIWITHEAEVQMEDEKEKLVPTAGTRNFARNFARYFSHVIYCDKVLNVGGKPGEPSVKHIAASSSTYKSNIITASNVALEKETKPTLFPIFGHLKPEDIDEQFSFLPVQETGTVSTVTASVVGEVKKAEVPPSAKIITAQPTATKVVNPGLAALMSKANLNK